MNNKVVIGAGIGAAILTIVVLLRHKISSTINAAMGTYFTIGELTYSSTAVQRNIDNTPTYEAKKNLQLLIDKVLDPIRSRYGKPINVSSGYRCPVLNAAVGGQKNSQHTTGCAADLVPGSKDGSLADIFRAAVKCNNYDQLIIEQSGNSRWIHVSYAPAPRKQMLAYQNGTYYAIGNSNYEEYLKA